MFTCLVHMLPLCIHKLGSCPPTMCICCIVSLLLLIRLCITLRAAGNVLSCQQVQQVFQALWPRWRLLGLFAPAQTVFVEGKYGRDTKANAWSTQAKIKTVQHFQFVCMHALVKQIRYVYLTAGRGSKSPETAVPQTNSLLAVQQMMQQLFCDQRWPEMFHQECLHIPCAMLALSYSLLARQQHPVPQEILMTRKTSANCLL